MITKKKVKCKGVCGLKRTFFFVLDMISEAQLVGVLPARKCLNCGRSNTHSPRGGRVQLLTHTHTDWSVGKWSASRHIDVPTVVHRQTLQRSRYVALRKVCLKLNKQQALNLAKGDSTPPRWLNRQQATSVAVVSRRHKREPIIGEWCERFRAVCSLCTGV